MNLDEIYMREALDLARLGMGRTLPNPMVGAVVVKNNQIIGRGFHQKFGFAHAEVNAILDAEKNGHDVAGADLYCTLEPCSHTNKKTPPCAQMITSKKIQRMVIATLDQNPEVSGNGVKILEDGPVLPDIRFGYAPDGHARAPTSLNTLGDPECFLLPCHYTF